MVALVGRTQHALEAGFAGQQTSGREVESHVYDNATALRKSSTSFGKPVRAYTYNADGTISTVSDAANRVTRLFNHKRGKPQLVTHPDGNSESQVLNNLGNADSRTNAVGTTSYFSYDAMGRVSNITHPGGDAVGYHPTVQAFEQVGFPEYGLPAGHWRQAISSGNARLVRFFDALWRERLEVRYDAANPGGTSSFEETRYDLDGRKAFESYPARNLSTVDAALAGRTTLYDAIGRVVEQQADSELGLLKTITTYTPTSYRRLVKNPRNKSTTFTFQAFDEPVEDSIRQITAPEGVSVSIVRDVFGKPTGITRSGGGASATRSYTYDSNQRLCKTVEPESGATVQGYDLAGNVAWRASGLSGGSSCTESGVAASRKVSFGRNAR